MSKYGSPISLSPMSHSSEDESFDQNAYNLGGGGGSGLSCPHHRQQSTSTRHHLQALASSHKRPRGRPPGSKNKPKPPIVITQDNKEALRPVVIEVANGLDVVKALVNFARLRHVGISVLSASGSISNVTLRHPLSHSPAFTIHGPFTLLALTGTYIFGPSPPPRPLVVQPSSSLALNPNPAFASYTNSFGISLLGSQGEIFGGVIDGKVVAGSTVTVMATLFKKPEFYKVECNGNDEGSVGEKDHDRSASGGGDNIMSALLNPQVLSAEDDVMQWGHIYSSTFSRNY